MKMSKIYRGFPKVASVFLLLLISFAATAQSKVISGTITDVQGSPMPGVNVVIKGTTTGATTNINGVYTLEATDDAVLVVSFIGFKTQEIRVGNLTKIDLKLEEDVATLEEIVVVGYGTQKKSDLTGAVGQVSEDKLKNSVVTNIDQALQGRIAGVQITNNSGAPGGAVSIRIRGNSSITGSNEPLYVIDGIQFQGDGNTVAGFDWAGGANGQNRVNPLSTINPADIVSIEVLKDASASAIYGSRAANGVVIITTRRGKAGQANITYDGYYGLQTLPRKISMMNLRQYAAYQVQINNEVDGLTLNERYLDPSILGEGTDWQDEVFREAPMQSHQLSVSGGNENSTYAISGGFFTQDGIIIGSGFDRYSIRANLDNKVNNWFKIGTSIGFTKTDETITLNDGGDGVISQALVTPPDIPVRDLDGNLAGPTQGTAELGSNPVGLALLRNNILGRQRLMANIYSEIKLPVKGMVLRSEIGIDNNHSINRAFIPTYQWGVLTNSLSRLRQREENSFYWILKNYLTYDFKLEGGHGFIAMLGTEAQKSSWEGSEVTKLNLATNNLPVLSQGDQAGSAINGWKDASSLASYFGRVNYNYNERYLLTFTLRADGSSKFGPNNRWGVFPSASFKWRVMNESFMPQSNMLTDLNVRLGYGEVGNQAIPNYSFGSALNTVNTAFGTGYRSARISNPDLKWEATVQRNIGVDMSLWSGRADLTLDLYQKDTRDMLLQIPIPNYLGGSGGPSSPYVNTGKMENKGIELGLNTRNMDRGSFQWSSDVTFTLNRNKVIDLERNFTRNLYWYSEFQTATNTVEGRPIGSFYGYEVVGYFKDQADILNSPVQVKQDGSETGENPNGVNYMHQRDGIWVGDLKFKDQNGDGVINPADQVFIGNPQPKFTYGINNRFNYKDFELSVFLTGVYGGEILNYSRVRIEGQISPFNNQASTVADRAQVALIDENGSKTDPANVYLANPDAKVPRFSTNDVNRNNRMSDRFIEDGTYLRIQNVTLAYNVPQRWTRKVAMQRARVYMNVQNLYVFTNYTGIDPEIGSFNQGPLLQNVDMGRYPQPRIYTVGGVITF
jgi:TonB-dependent starch-binding outer membrane protein SusC